MIKTWERKAIIFATDQTMFDVLQSCRMTPLTRVVSRRFCGSLISAGDTRDGPSGRNVSNDLPRLHCPPPFLPCHLLSRGCHC